MFAITYQYYSYHHLGSPLRSHPNTFSHMQYVSKLLVHRWMSQRERSTPMTCLLGCSLRLVRQCDQCVECSCPSILHSFYVWEGPGLSGKLSGLESKYHDWAWWISLCICFLAIEWRGDTKLRNGVLVCRWGGRMRNLRRFSLTMAAKFSIFSLAGARRTWIPTSSSSEDGLGLLLAASETFSI